MSATAAAEPVLGVDGCPGGWVAALVGGDLRVRWLRAGSVAGILDEAAAVGIDIPIGLPDSGRRDADQAARDRIGPARSSVFYAPVRAVLDAPSYAEANRRSRERGGHGLSRQCWHLVPRIVDVDRAMTADRQRRVVEVHPEVSFRHLDPRVTDSKRRASGIEQRLRALGGWLDLSGLGEVPPGVRLHDALDALVVAWSAARWRDRVAAVLPHADPPTDRRGLRMEIVA